jgi:hypothetical protein
MKGLFAFLCFLAMAATGRIVDACCFGANCHCTAPGVECCAGTSCGIEGDCLSDSDRAKVKSTTDSKKGKTTKNSAKTGDSAKSSKEDAAKPGDKKVAPVPRATAAQSSTASDSAGSTCTPGWQQCGPESLQYCCNSPAGYHCILASGYMCVR